MLDRQMRRLTGLRPGEGVPALLAALLFFCLMTAYFILKPLRDEMGIAGGVRNLPNLYLFTLGTMLVAAPLFGRLARGRDRDVFLPVVYRFFMANLAAFYLLLEFWPAGAARVGRVFYVWVSVYNLFSLSLFWGFMADGFGFRHGRRAFGVIAVGGTLGGVLGSSLTAGLVRLIGREPLLLVSLACLQTAVLLIGVLSRRFRAPDFGQPSAAPSPATAAATAGPATGAPAVEPAAAGARPRPSALRGIQLTLRSPYLLAISAFLLLYTLSSTFLYFEQAHIVAAAETARDARTALLARIEIWVQAVTLVLQLLVAGRVMRVLGTAWALALLPVLTAGGFLALAVTPTLGVLIAFQVVRKAVNYGLVKPARESLYTPLSAEAKYQAKSFVDTFVYRGGDALGAAAFERLLAGGLGLSGVSLVAVGLATVWTAVAVRLGRQHTRLAAGDPASSEIRPAAAPATTARTAPARP